MLNKSITKLLLSFFILFLAGCASMAPPATTSQTNVNTNAPQQTLTWSQRQAQLAALHNWNLSSAFSIRDQQQASIASLNWQQHGRYYTQTIAGPFNLGGVRIVGSPGKVTLIRSATQQVSANNPEELLQKELNLRLPISNLYYWIRGIPVAGVPASHEQFDQANHLVAMQQEGWQITYPNFTTVNGIDLPSKILLANSELNVKIVIRQWQI